MRSERPPGEKQHGGGGGGLSKDPLRLNREGTKGVGKRGEEGKSPKLVSEGWEQKERMYFRKEGG